MNPSIDLAPCPLCRESVQLQLCHDANNPMKSWVRCRQCKCQAPLLVWNGKRADIPAWIDDADKIVFELMTYPEQKAYGRGYYSGRKREREELNKSARK